MPWWFWPLAVLWTVPLLLVAALVVAVAREVLKDRRIARAEADAERRAEALIMRDAAALMAKGNGTMVWGDDSITDAIDRQRFNPRVHGRADYWRT